MSNEPQKPTILVAVDIEGTGGPNNRVLAVGFAHATLTTDEDGDVDVQPNQVRRIVLRRDIVTFKDEERKNYSLKDAYLERGYDKETWTQFWSRFENVLQDLINNAPHDESDAEFGTRISDEIEKLEAMGNVQFLTDTIWYDVPQIDALLRAANLPMMTYTRKGKYMGARMLHLGSYIAGAERTLPFSSTDTPLRKVSRDYADTLAPHSHFPDSDANNILLRYLYVASQNKPQAKRIKLTTEE